MTQNLESNFPSATDANAVASPLDAVLQGTQQPAASEQADTSEDDAVPGYNRFLDLSEGETPKADICVINLYADACFDCKHLVENADVDYAKCHFSRGNEHCPASNLRIQFVGPRVKWDKKIAKIEAMEAGIAKRNAQTALFDAAREIEEESLREYVMSKILR